MLVSYADKNCLIHQHALEALEELVCGFQS